MSRVESELILKARVDAGNTQQELGKITIQIDHVTKSSGEAAKATDDWQSKIVAVDAALNLAGRGLRAFNAVSVEGARMALEQREGVDQLRNALSPLGIAYSDVEEQINTFAAAQQATTVYGDDVTRAIIGQVAALTQEYAPSLQQIIELTSLTQDVMAQTGRSASEVTMLIGKVYAGNAEAITELLPDTREYFRELRTNGVSSAELVAEALGVLEDRFGGAAANIDPARIAVARMVNGLGDLREALGDVVLDVGEASGVFSGIADTIDTLAYALGEGGPAAEGFGEAMANAAEVGEGAIRGLAIGIMVALRTVATAGLRIQQMVEGRTSEQINATMQSLAEVERLGAESSQRGTSPNTSMLQMALPLGSQIALEAGGRGLDQSAIDDAARRLDDLGLEDRASALREAETDDEMRAAARASTDSLNNLNDAVGGRVQELESSIDTMIGAFDETMRIVSGGASRSGVERDVMSFLGESWPTMFGPDERQTAGRGGFQPPSGGGESAEKPNALQARLPGLRATIYGGKEGEDEERGDDMLAGITEMSEALASVTGITDALSIMGDVGAAEFARIADEVRATTAAQELMQEQVNSIKVDGFQALGDVAGAAFYDMASGSAAFGESFAKNTLSAIGSMASSLGSMFILAGTASAALPFLGASGPAAIAAGIGLNVLGGALGGASTGIGAGASGSSSAGRSDAGTGLGDAMRARETGARATPKAIYDFAGATIVTEDVATFRRLRRGTDRAGAMGGTSGAGL